MFYRASVVALLTAVLGATVADACKCRQPPPPKESLEQSDAVFLGKVTDIAEAENGIVVTLEVAMTWKGVEEPTVAVSTASHSAACGFGFEKGKEYVVYAHKSEDKLSTNICTRTRAFDGKDKSEIEALGEPDKMPPAPEPK